MTLLMLLMIFLSVMYFMNTPISCILILILIAIVISLMILNIFHSTWLSLVIFLMMVGSMLVLFIYMTSISPNKKLSRTSKCMTIKLAVLCNSMSLIFSQNHFYLMNQSINESPLILFMIFSIYYLFLFLLILTLILKKINSLRSS